jgi:EAL domain-containing protein (putative c-di-GMP-specific phosphodiesterase class I)
MTGPVGRAALDRALDEKEDLLLVYQPIHEASTRKIVSAEALLRQRRQTGEIREAGIITETAEQGPELFVLDSLLMQTAFEDAARWQKIAEVHLNVNLSPREFEQQDLIDRLAALLSGSGIDAAKVDLEITETHYMKQPKETLETLNELKRRGLRLWLDDFGTGHSSLTHIQHFPLDGLKIPGAFVAQIPNDRRCRAIIHALIRLAHDIGLRVIAEEVERDDQLAFLLDCDCDHVQGFLFSKPMEINDLLTTLQQS